MATGAGSSDLLEREQELAALEQAWRSASEGRGSTWLICSEAGGGRTRLVEALASCVETQPAPGRGRRVSQEHIGLLHAPGKDEREYDAIRANVLVAGPSAGCTTAAVARRLRLTG
jgi:predicted ATPase